MPFNVEVTDEDIAFGKAAGLTGAQVIELSIHRAFDEKGVPQDGRNITVTEDHIAFNLPVGWVDPDEDE